MRTRSDLSQMQALPLNIKIRMTQERIRQWVHEYGVDGVFVSFSGGKDSTVLLDLVRKLYPDIPAVFVDVPTQYPELREFAKTFPNVEIIRPKISFAKVCEKYGFPMISKEVSECVQGARKYLTKVAEETQSSEQSRAEQSSRISIGTRELAARESMENPSRGGQTESTEGSTGYLNLANQIAETDLYSMPYRMAKLLGQFQMDWGKKKAGVIPKTDDRSSFSLEKYKFFLDAPFDISHKCCDVMKKAPIYEYEKRTGRHGMTGQMADESKLRTQAWLKNGCNAFQATHPVSNPMAFWKENDVLQYIYENKLPICPVYGEVVIDNDIDGQMDITDFIDADVRQKYKTTGCNRTGCSLCGFGCHLEGKENSRFLMLKETHPQLYSMLDVMKNNGYTFREAIEWYNAHVDDKRKIYL